MLNRGTHDLPEQAKVEKLIADREKDLDVLSGRSFDVVIDTCGYHPEVVRLSLNALQRAVGTYVFISTVSVYGKFAASGIPRAIRSDIHLAGEQGDYGSLKASLRKCCFRADGWQRAYQAWANSWSLRSDRPFYLLARVASGGMILSSAPGRPDRAIQFIDVRDLAAWILYLAQAQGRGIYNATGPKERLSMGGFPQACKQAVGKDGQFVWVDDDALLKAGVEEWAGLPLWISNSNRDFAGFMQFDCRKAFDPVCNRYRWLKQ